MATRTVFFLSATYPYYKEETVSFTWAMGSKQKNIRAVHDVVRTVHPDAAILEVNHASDQPEGAAVSPLQLTLRIGALEREVPLINVYEAAKIFEKGGPYADLLRTAPQKVRKNPRLRNSGALVGYSLEGANYPAEPADAFFSWIYCRALKQSAEKADKVARYTAFTDISTSADTRKYYGAPAQATAIFAGLACAKKLSCIDTYEDFVATVYTEPAAEESATPPEQVEEEPAKEVAAAESTEPQKEPVPDKTQENDNGIPTTELLKQILDLPSPSI